MRTENRGNQIDSKREPFCHTAILLKAKPVASFKPLDSFSWKKSAKACICQTLLDFLSRVNNEEKVQQERQKQKPFWDTVQEWKLSRHGVQVRHDEQMCCAKMRLQTYCATIDALIYPLEIWEAKKIVAQEFANLRFHGFMVNFANLPFYALKTATWDHRFTILPVHCAFPRSNRLYHFTVWRFDGAPWPNTCLGPVLARSTAQHAVPSFEQWFPPERTLIGKS